MSHTPGPWYAVNDDEQQVIDITPCLPDEDGELEKTIATVWGNRPSLKATVEGDARLIAAAPDLLGKLRRCLSLLEDLLPEPEVRKTEEPEAHALIAEIYQAIAQATGGEV